MARKSSCLTHPMQNGKRGEKLSTKTWRTSLRLVLKHWSLNDLPHNLAGFWSPSFVAISIGSADDCADVHAEADAEDCGLGLLRCEDAVGPACQVGRYRGDSDTHHEQSEAARRGGPPAGAGRAIAARHHRSS